MTEPLELIARGEQILTTLHAAGLTLDDPLNLLALQLLGPILAKAMGDDVRRNQENLAAIVDLLDVKGVQALLLGQGVYDR